MKATWKLYWVEVAFEPTDNCFVVAKNARSARSVEYAQWVESYDEISAEFVLEIPEHIEEKIIEHYRGILQKRMDSFNRLRRSLFSIQGAIASIGIGEFVRRSIRSFAEFETGLVGVGKTTGMAGQELEELGKRIIALSKSTPVARNQLLDIAQAAGQLGISGNDNILKFTDTIAKMGAATDLVGDEAAVTMARILSITGEAVQSVDKLGSTLVFLGNASSATEAEIARMTIELAKATAQFNVSSANLAGLTAQ